MGRHTTGPLRKKKTNYSYRENQLLQIRAMDEEQSQQLQSAEETEEDVPEGTTEGIKPTPTCRIDPKRMIGIIRRKALIKELAAAYHAECLAYCQELLELQKNAEEPIFDFKTPEDEMRKERPKPPKRSRKAR